MNPTRGRPCAIAPDIAFPVGKVGKNLRSSAGRDQTGPSHDRQVARCSSSAETLRGYDEGGLVEREPNPAHWLGNLEGHMAKLHEDTLVEIPFRSDCRIRAGVERGSEASQGIVHRVDCCFQLIPLLRKRRVPLFPGGKRRFHFLQLESKLRVLILDPG